MISFSSPLIAIPGIGNKTAEKFRELGIATIKDLLYHIPFRYDDFRKQKTINQLEENDQVTIRARVVSITKLPTKHANLTMIKAQLADETGKIEAIWFNQPYLLLSLKKETEHYFSATVSSFYGKKSLQNPSIESVTNQEHLHSGRLVPIYPQTANLSSRTIRKSIAMVFSLLQSIPDIYSLDFITKHHLPPLFKTLQTLHFPNSTEKLSLYQHRLAFDEILELLLKAKKKKQQRQQTLPVKKLLIHPKIKQDFIRTLPYPLTASQSKAIQDISEDLIKPYPGMRLIQGEVGSGKTTVAAFALFAASMNNAVGILVAPTQILAEQHALTLKPIFDSLNTPLVLCTAQHQLSSLPHQGVVIATHAIFEHAQTLKPAVIVIDEEHRFGVDQKHTFSQTKYKKKPHTILMSATPIPRTSVQTTLAHIDESFLDEIETKKKKITTKVVDEKNRQKAYQWIAQRIKKTQEQVFVVCPFIQQSEQDSLSSVKSAEKEFQTIKAQFPDFRVALLHAKISEEKKKEIVHHLRTQSLDILVCTSVIEVGIDIPRAGIILIEGAERFGLAQLHQLRGRVGRAGQQAFCFLFLSEKSEEDQRNAFALLKKLEILSNGNELAELDIRNRGSGEILGNRQHGWNDLRFGSWFDTALIQKCHGIAKEMV